MNITLLTVGKTDRNWVWDGFEIYRSRLIMKCLRDSDEVILLDEKGREYTSVEWAGMISKRLSAGSRNIVFVIGGAYGFSPQVYGRASSLVSLSRMTFSHQMVRTIFLEQLYRAFTIIKGEPYHHE